MKHCPNEIIKWNYRVPHLFFAMKNAPRVLWNVLPWNKIFPRCWSCWLTFDDRISCALEFSSPKKTCPTLWKKKTTQRSAAHQVASRLSNILKQKNSKQQKNDKNIPPPPPMNEIAPIFFYFNENIWHAGSPPFPPTPVPHAPPTSLVSTLRSADSQTLDELEKKNILTIFTT